MRSINLNRLVRIGIRGKLVVAFLLLSTGPLLLSGLYAIHVHTQSLERSELEHLEHDVLTVRERTATFLRGVESDIRYLAASFLFRLYLDRPDDAHVRSDLLRQLIDFAGSKSIYYQVRYLDAEGTERLRVVRLDRGPVERPPDPSLGGRFFEHLLEGAAPGDLAWAPVEVVGEGGSLIAAFSYVLRVALGESRYGLLVVDVYARDLFRTIEEAHENVGGQAVLVTGEGHYVYHSERKTDWSRLLAEREEYNLFRDHPASVAEAILAGKPGVLSCESDVIAFAPLLEKAANLGVYTLAMSVPRAQVLVPVGRFKRAFYGLLAFFVVLSVVFAFVAAAQFTRPINALQKEAEVIAGGDFGRRLRVETYDEIQKLAESFNAMARAVQEREGVIRRHQSELEATVADRTAELSEEKAKLQAILDSVPSAFVVLDRDLHILSASRAFERISGHAPEAVIGTHYARFFPDCVGVCPAREVLRTGKTVTDVQRLSLPGNPEPLYLERIALPVRRDGALDRIIEVVTDITERKQMEARVIHSEKLATTGEMAAVIAHEMRNSLTSVKMILQLELEREDLDAADREALDVASRSVRRMETIVTDLLRFARPSPPDSQVRPVAPLVEQAIALIQHELRRKRIDLTVDTPNRLPPVLADGDQLKEVLVNLLLNAVQAVSAGGRIRIGAGVAQGGLQVRIDDDGPGIPDAGRERVFDPFFTTKPDGTGLGLSMAQRIVEAHGGRIRAGHSAWGGASFSVWLPGATERLASLPDRLPGPHLEIA